MANIAITGGSGFVGTLLAEKLLQQGHKVRIIDKIISQRFPNLTQQCDICDLKTLEKAFSGMDVIYHLAAVHRDDVTPVSLYHDVNVIGTRNVGTAALKNNIKRIIFTSSVAVYGFCDSDADESASISPFNEYGRTKYGAEQELRQWQSKGDNLKLAIVRPTVIFGHGNRGNVYNLLKQIVRFPFLMVGDGKNRKSMAYIENVVEFLIFLLNREETNLLSNYVDKPDFDMNSLVYSIGQVTGRKTGFIRLPCWFGLLIGHTFDFIAKITGKRFPFSSIRIKKFTGNTIFSSGTMSVLGFLPAIDLPTALEKTIQFEFGDLKD